jgi:hypothetical protein
MGSFEYQLRFAQAIDQISSIFETEPSPILTGCKIENGAYII